MLNVKKIYVIVNYKRFLEDSMKLPESPAVKAVAPRDTVAVDSLTSDSATVTFTKR